MKGQKPKSEDHTHLSALDLKKLLPRRHFERFFKFAFVRNPWDWQVSLFHYMLKEERHPQHELIRTMSGFDEYIEWRVQEDLHLQKDLVTDQDDELLVDYVGKLENINRDFESICRRIGVSAKLPHLNKSRHRNYREYYNRSSWNLVADAFRDDIEFFGYKEKPIPAPENS